jgi:hypothetical protein
MSLHISDAMALGARGMTAVTLGGQPFFDIAFCVLNDFVRSKHEEIRLEGWVEPDLFLGGQRKPPQMLQFRLSPQENHGMTERNFAFFAPS